MAMYGALISSQDQGLAVACAVLSYSSFSDAMGHDNALEQERADHPASIGARRLARHPTASAAISVSRRASIAQTQPASARWRRAWKKHLSWSSGGKDIASSLSPPPAPSTNSPKPPMPAPNAPSPWRRTPAAAPRGFLPTRAP